MKSFAKFLLVFGLVMVVVSLLLDQANPPGSPENLIGQLNIALGGSMLLLAILYLGYQKRKDTKENDKKPLEK